MCFVCVCVFSGQTSLNFAGNSYIKYRVTDSIQDGEIRLGLRIRTLQSRGVIMFTRANPCTMLKVLDTDARMDTCRHKHTHAWTHADTNIHTPGYKQTYIHTHGHTHAHTQTQTHTHTHTQLKCILSQAHMDINVNT